ncbi:IS5 family transposase [Streptomyces anulatus]|uniref:IS5 family transposase n=1 Tax=Streptomyces anulatus TaxID=1892 RepID=UPI0036C438E3
MGRGDLTDEQWATPEPLLPRGIKAGRPPVWPRRQLIDGIRFRVRTGAPWRDAPVEYGPWSRIYDLFRRWQRNGTWQWTLTRLQSLADAKGAIVWDLSVDSAVCRAHQHAAGARKQGDLQKEPPGGIFAEPHDHGLGRSRGGFTTKLHLAVEQGQKPMTIVVTAGQRGDSPQFEPVLEKVRSVRAAVCSRSCFSRVASRYSAARSRALSAAFVAAAMASAPLGLCLNQRRPCSVL